MKTKLTFIVLTTLALTACSDNDTKSVDYYKEHTTERNATLKKCSEDDFKNDQNCINALKAGKSSTTGTNNTDYTGSFSIK